MKKVAVLIAVLAFFVSLSFAAATPVKLSLVEKIALPPIDTLRGIELGIGNYSPDMGGLQFNLIYGRTDKGIGLQLGLVNIAKRMGGVQWGFFNYSGQKVSGIQFGTINVASGQKVSGIQLGTVNVASSISGLQFGLINLSERLYGVQIGLINYNKSGNIANLPFTIILNAKF